MSSLGYVMMNWTSELIKSSKKRKRKEMKLKQQQEEAKCAKCLPNLDQIQNLEEDLEQLQHLHSTVVNKLEHAKSNLAIAKERECQLRDANEKLVLEEAQARYELDELMKQNNEKLKQNMLAHGQQLKNMEQVLIDKEREWAERNDCLQNDLGHALRTSWENSNIESMSRAQLEQELFSLRTVLEMRQSELQHMRQLKQDLEQKLEHHHWLDSELSKARQRLEEMNLVVQNKMLAEKEMLDLTESLTNDLANARNDILNLRRELENREYLQNQLVCRRNSEDTDPESQLSSPDAVGYKNQHQKLW